MPVSLPELERELSELPVDERARLASFLLATLEPADEGEIEAAWIAEAERRWSAFQAGEVAVVPAEQVFAEARRRLRDRR